MLLLAEMKCKILRACSAQNGPAHGWDLPNLQDFRNNTVLYFSIADSQLVPVSNVQCTRPVSENELTESRF